MPVCSHPPDQTEPLFPASDYITGRQFGIARCPACGFVVTTPQLPGQDLAACYPPEYYGAAGQRPFFKLVERGQSALCRRRVRRVESGRGAAPGRVLDVGCGPGWLLHAFRQRGWDAQGTELSDPAATHARRVLGLPVATGASERLGFPDQHFDAVTLWHVLEHVADPRGVLAEVHRVLQPGGVLLVSVPNFGGWEAQLCRDKWFHLDVPRHRTHFTRVSLGQALAAAGFEPRHWSGFAPEYDAFSLVQSLLNRCGLRHNLLYNLLRSRDAKVLREGKTPAWQVPATLALAAPLGLLSLPAILLAGWAGQAGTMTVLAVRRAD